MWLSLYEIAAGGGGGWEAEKVGGGGVRRWYKTTCNLEIMPSGTFLMSYFF